MFSVYFGILCLLATSFIFEPINPAPTIIYSDSLNHYENENDGSGNYKFSFKTLDSKREETGRVVNAGQPDQYIQVDGFYSYKNDIPGGFERWTFNYTAGKDGYKITNKAYGAYLSGAGAIPPLVIATLTG